MGTHSLSAQASITVGKLHTVPQLPQLFPLGRFFSYNNAAFILLGRLIEVACGTDFNTAMQNLVFGPLGLSDTLLDRDEVLKRQYVIEYTLPDGVKPSDRLSVTVKRKGVTLRAPTRVPDK